MSASLVDFYSETTMNDHDSDPITKNGVAESTVSTVRALKAFDADKTFESSQKYYNEKWAETYEFDMVNTLGYEAPKIIARALDNFLCNSGIELDAVKILDIGCGTGLVAHELRLRGFTNIDGLDPSPAMLDKARERNVYDHLYESTVEADRPAQGIKLGSYDIITSSASFAHAHVPVPALRQLLRLIKPQTGLLAICYRPHIMFEGEREYIEDMGRVQKEMVAEGAVVLEHDEIFEHYVNYNGWKNGRCVIYRNKSTEQKQLNGQLNGH